MDTWASDRAPEPPVPPPLPHSGCLTLCAALAHPVTLGTLWRSGGEDWHQCSPPISPEGSALQREWESRSSEPGEGIPRPFWLGQPRCLAEGAPALLHPSPLWGRMGRGAGRSPIKSPSSPTPALQTLTPCLALISLHLFRGAVSSCSSREVTLLKHSHSLPTTFPDSPLPTAMFLKPPYPKGRRAMSPDIHDKSPWSGKGFGRN